MRTIKGVVSSEQLAQIFLEDGAGYIFAVARHSHRLEYYINKQNEVGTKYKFLCL